MGLTILRLGRMGYQQALAVQHRLVEKVKAGREGVLVLVEHDPVYTTGMRTKVYSLEEETRLKALGADFVRTNRGGLITFHGPGQLVAYPIIDLKKVAPKESRRKAMLGMKWYVENLEQVVIDLLSSSYSLHGFRSPHTGVWLKTRGPHQMSKICALGVHNSDLVTSHGLALNCTTDMSWFDQIVPCGIQVDHSLPYKDLHSCQGAGVTSLAQMVRGEDVSVDTVGETLIGHFGETFNCESRDIEDEERVELIEGL